MNILKIFTKIKNKLSLLTSAKSKRHHEVGPAALWKMKRDFQFSFLKNHGLKPTHHFLDIGCGTLRGGIPVIKYLNKGNYYGIDIRKELLEEIDKEIAEEGVKHKCPHIIIFESFNDLNLEVKMDSILAFSVLIHMDDRIVADCLGFAARHLNKNGAFYANVNLGGINKIGQ